MSKPDGPPPRPLPTVECPSPLDRLPPFARPLAVSLAEEEARDLIRRSVASGSVYRLSVEQHGPVVDYLLDLPKGELEERVKAHDLERERLRREAQAEERARKLGRSPGPSTASLSYAQILGREPVPPTRERHEPRRTDDDERRAIAEESAA